MSDNTRKKTIAVAMSGGVDSSVAAVLLKNEGYEIIGITLKLWLDDALPDHQNGGLTAIQDAKAMADFLNIPHHVIDYRDRFKGEVIDYFIGAYLSGVTPNPCPTCNDTIKFGVMLNEARKLGADYMATGHYVRLFEKMGTFYIKKGLDPIKDQSYFLYRLDQKRLAQVKFPLGDYHKTQIRQIATEYDLPVKDKPESQDICFIESDSYRDFLIKHADTTFKKGPITTDEGKKVGQHKGLPFYTIGQRRGLGVALGKPTYVTRIDFENNTLVVGDDQQRRKSVVLVDKVSFITGELPTDPIPITVKIRSTAKEAPAMLTPLNNHQARIVSSKPLLDVAPGQSAVFYQDDVLLGGGIIRKD